MVIPKIPVFAFPTAFKFYVQTKSTHKQLLTLYNPYDFPIRFKILCTAPTKYSVTDPEGSIPPGKQADVVVRHNALTVNNCNVTDKFRVSMEEHTTHQFLGKRDIESTLLPGEKDSVEGDFQDLLRAQRNTNDDQRVYLNNTSTPTNSNYVIALVIGLVCIIALLLPTQEETAQPSSIPKYLHISINFKLVLAYVLGLVSMVIFQP